MRAMADAVTARCIDHIASLPSQPILGDVAAEVERLRGLGVEVGDPFELNGTQQAFFHDPSGNQLELNQPGQPG